MIPIDFRNEAFRTYFTLDHAIRRGVLDHLKALTRGIDAFDPGAHDFVTNHAGVRLLCAVEKHPVPVLAVIRVERLPPHVDGA